MGEMMTRKARAFVVALVATLLLAFGGKAAWAVDWVPWDGNHITSQENCQSRRVYIAKTYSIPLRALRCQQYPPNSCGGAPYWLLEIDVDAAVAPSDLPATTAADHLSWTDQPVAAGC
jgi:hypothetical protein